MTTDDEILFGRVSDETRSSYERVQRLRVSGTSAVSPDLGITLAEFELHGSTLRSLRRLYPREDRVNAVLAEWQRLSLKLASQGLSVEA